MGNIEGDATALGCAELFVQLKDVETREDPYQDPTPGTVIPEFSFIRDFYEELGSDGDDNEDEEMDIEDTYTKNQGEVSAYAAELCARQFRTHCFSVSVYGTKVRLFRWDRAGVIISRAFDILEKPDLLCLFMWRYANATDAQRGYDTSVTRASKEEEDIFAQIIRKHVKEQLSVESDALDNLVKEHYEPNSVYKFSIHPRRPRKKKPSVVKNDMSSSTDSDTKTHPWDEVWKDANKLESEDTPGTVSNEKCEMGVSSSHSKSRAYSEVQYFLVSRPVVTPTKSISHGTRGYWSVKLPDKSIGETDHVIAFVKDTWRDDNEDTEIEGDVVIGNVEAGVKFVSDIFCHGDVKTGIKKDANTECIVKNCKHYYLECFVCILTNLLKRSHNADGEICESEMELL